MKTFIETLYYRNEPLFIFGTVMFVLAALFLGFSRFSSVEVSGVNAWYKPVKFALSLGIYAWTMGWYVWYLGNTPVVKIFNWTVIILFGFEIVYIAIQAAKGELSHFNVSTPLYSFLYTMMAVAAAGVTLYTAYIGILFFRNDFPDLPDYYLWAIRFGIILFVIFAFEGFLMGSMMTHTSGGPDGGEGIPFLNWSRKYGDPRVAHFIGMHALQILPLLAFYVLKNVKLTFAAAAVYTLIAIYVLAQALNGRPFLKY